MTSLHDMNIQEALNHSSFGGPSGVPSPTQAMLMMQKALSAGNTAFPGAIPPSSAYPLLPAKDMMSVAASLGGSQANLMTQYYQMYQKLWGAALANGQGSPNGQLTHSLPGHGHPPHVPLPPSLPSALPTTSTATNLLMSSSSLSSPTSTSSGLTSHQPSPLESFHHNANSQGKIYCLSNHGSDIFIISKNVVIRIPLTIPLFNSKLNNNADHRS